MTNYASLKYKILHHSISIQSAFEKILSFKQLTIYLSEKLSVKIFFEKLFSCQNVVIFSDLENTEDCYTTTSYFWRRQHLIPGRLASSRPLAPRSSRARPPPQLHGLAEGRHQEVPEQGKNDPHLPLLRRRQARCCRAGRPRSSGRRRRAGGEGPAGARLGSTVGTRA